MENHYYKSSETAEFWEDAFIVFVSSILTNQANFFIQAHALCKIFAISKSYCELLHTVTTLILLIQHAHHHRTLKTLKSLLFHHSRSFYGNSNSKLDSRLNFSTFLTSPAILSAGSRSASSKFSQRMPSETVMYNFLF